MKAALPLAMLALTLAACVPATEAPPAPAAAQRPVTSPAARPSPAPPPAEPARPDAAWIDQPATPGEWSYGTGPSGTFAVFASNARYAFAISCESNPRRITLFHLDPASDSGARTLTIWTETGSRPLAARSDVNGTGAALEPRDPLLDAMALSKGRFAVEVEGETPLILPSHAEVSRVIEDCR